MGPSHRGAGGSAGPPLRQQGETEWPSRRQAAPPAAKIGRRRERPARSSATKVSLPRRWASSPSPFPGKPAVQLDLSSGGNQSPSPGVCSPACQRGPGRHPALPSSAPPPSPRPSTCKQTKKRAAPCGSLFICNRVARRPPRKTGVCRPPRWPPGPAKSPGPALPPAPIAWTCSSSSPPVSFFRSILPPIRPVV